jgi:ubiquinone/menaquinone biosynthesis C-methylase UbiE
MGYVTKQRFASYWYQIKEVILSEPTSVLEIGIGPNLVSSYLIQNKIKVVTIDFDIKLKPQLVGSVMQLPIRDVSFDTVLCCQVLEHFPFQNFSQCLSELKRITKKKLILSLPDKTLTLSFLLRSSKRISWDFLLPFPWAFRRHIIGNVKGHHWEIGERGYPYKGLTKKIEQAGFSVDRIYRVPDHPYHRFFIVTPV